MAVAFLSLFLIPYIANGQIFSQTSTSSGGIILHDPISNVGFSINAFFDLPAGTTGFVESFDFFAGSNSLGNTGIQFLIFEFPDPDFLTATATDIGFYTENAIDNSCQYISQGAIPQQYNVGFSKDRFSIGGLEATSSVFLRSDRFYRIEMSDCQASFFNGTTPPELFGSGGTSTLNCWLGDDPNGTLNTCANAGLGFPFMVINEFSGNTGVTEIVQPTAGTTTATTTVNVIVDLFNSGSADVLTLFVDDRVTNQQVIIDPFDFAISGGFVTVDVDIELPTGSYTLRAVTFNTVTGSQFGNVLRVDFNVINNEFLEVFGVDITDVDDLITLATTTCSFTNITGCFQNALVFAFVPAESSFDRFITLKDQLINKPPFGYFALLANGLSGLNSTSSPAFTLATEDNITNAIFTPLKTGLSFILFVFFGVWLYKRVIAIQL